MRRLLTRMHVLVAVAVLAIACGGVAAVAYWTGSGQGSGETQLPDADLPAFAAGTANDLLFPGGVVSVSIVATNPNQFSIRLESLVLDTSAGSGGFEVDGGHSGCDLSALAFAPQDNDGDGWTLPRRAGTTDGELAIDVDDALSMDVDADNACQGALFTIHLVAGA